MDILIGTAKITARIVYIVEIMFGRCLGLSVIFSTNQAEFDGYQGIKFGYGMRANTTFTITNLYLEAATLLFEETILPIVTDVVVDKKKNLKYLFSSSKVIDNQRLLDYDPLAAGFYLVSRYEEYLPFEPDLHGRFAPVCAQSAQNSLAPSRLWVQHWAIDLANALKIHFPNLIIRLPAFEIEASFDIDNAFAYRHKPLVRQLGGLARDILSKPIKTATDRMMSYLSYKTDKFDNMAQIKKICNRYEIEPIVFFLVCDYHRPYDTPLDYKHIALQNYIKSSAKWAKIGLHPGYYTHPERQSVSKQLERLSNILGYSPDKVRMHYLRLSFPNTYKSLIEADIKHDYTMGYAHTNGFRAGIALPFPWFDLSENKTTNLTIHPFCFMDSTSRFYLKHSPAQAHGQALELAQQIKQTGGVFSVLFHNEIFGDLATWPSWQNVFEDLINSVKKL